MRNEDTRLFASSKKDFSQMPSTDVIITEPVNYKQKLK